MFASVPIRPAHSRHPAHRWCRAAVLRLRQRQHQQLLQPRHLRPRQQRRQLLLRQLRLLLQDLLPLQEGPRCRGLILLRGRGRDSLGGSASPENASPARTDGRRVAEGTNIRRKAAMLCQRVEESPRRPFHLLVINACQSVAAFHRLGNPESVGRCAPQNHRQGKIRITIVIKYFALNCRQHWRPRLKRPRAKRFENGESLQCSTL